MSTNHSSDSESSTLKSRQKKQVETPRDIRHFTLTYDEWQRFYDQNPATVIENWSNQLARYITCASITCTEIFKKHHERKKNSRKKNCNVFSCHGRCDRNGCPVRLVAVVEREPNNKESPAIFAVFIFGNADHKSDETPASRRLSGPQRVAMGILVRSWKSSYKRFLL